MTTMLTEHDWMVEQRHRDAAAALYLELEEPPYSPKDLAAAEAHRRGDYDAHASIQAFARFEQSIRTTDAARIAALEAELERLRKMAQPEWFYLAGDTSSDRCRFSPDEVIDEDWLWDNRAEGSTVVQIETATRCPDIWCAVKFFTNEEKDARGLDDDYELTEHATEEEARATLTKDQTHDR